MEKAKGRRWRESKRVIEVEGRGNRNRLMKEDRRFK